MDFEVGNSVISIRDLDTLIGYNTNNYTGIIIKIKKSDLSDEIFYLVEFDKNIGGHDGNGIGQDGHYWWCRKNQIKLNKEEPGFKEYIKEIERRKKKC